MQVNFLKKRTFSPRGRFAIALLISYCAIFFLAAFITDHSDHAALSKRVNIAMRSIGHRLLLHAGDSTSTVPPVIEKSNGVFVLQLKNPFVFQSDTLIKITRRVLHKAGLTRYTVTVHECNSPAIVYGFEVNPPVNSIDACQGRIQAKGCYNIEIAFPDVPTPPVLSTQMMISGIVMMLIFTFIFSGSIFKKLSQKTEQHSSRQNETPNSLTIGKFMFDINRQTLKAGDETISLTDKECKILTLLNRNIGQLTLRDELIQEVWTDEGVITGRSLDMFISKLRKKISSDPTLRITNIHGRGYKLENVSE